MLTKDRHINISIAVKELIKRYEKYHPEPDSAKIKHAYELAEVVYLGEKRLNGEDWLNYTLELARLSSEMKLDTSTICAALLVDVYKFGFSPDDVSNELGPDVRSLLDALEKIRVLSNRYSSSNLDKDYAEYIRRLILTTGKDVRVVALRLVQKLHSLDSIFVFDSEHQEFMLKKAFDVYAPLADLIGMGLLKRRIQEKAFEIQDHDKYLMSKNLLATHFYSKDHKVEEVVRRLQTLLNEHDVTDASFLLRLDPKVFCLAIPTYSVSLRFLNQKPFFLNLPICRKYGTQDHTHCIHAFLLFLFEPHRSYHFLNQLLCEYFYNHSVLGT